jgi:hypothetical protein
MYEGSGRIIITVSGGSGLYQYSYNNGATYTDTTSDTTKTFNNLSDGNYTIKVKNPSNNLEYTYGSTVSIDCPPPFTATFTSGCDRNGYGFIVINASGGGGPYSYRITTILGVDTTSTFNTFGNLSNITYSIYATDTAYSNEIYVGQVTFDCAPPTTTTTTAAPLVMTISQGCTGYLGTGFINITGVSNGSGNYVYHIGPSNIDFSNPNAYSLTQSQSGLSNGGYYVAVYDSSQMRYTVEVRNINCETAPTTTTTTAAPTTTTTTTTEAPPPTTTTTTEAPPDCQQYNLYNSDTEYSDYYSYQSCDGNWIYDVELQYSGFTAICARTGTVSAGGAINISAPQGPCS